MIVNNSLQFEMQEMAVPLMRILHVSLLLAVMTVAVGCDPGMPYLRKREDARRELFYIGVAVAEKLNHGDDRPILEICRSLPEYQHLKFVEPENWTIADDEVLVLVDKQPRSTEPENKLPDFLLVRASPSFTPFSLEDPDLYGVALFVPFFGSSSVVMKNSELKKLTSFENAEAAWDWLHEHDGD